MSLVGCVQSFSFFLLGWVDQNTGFKTEKVETVKDIIVNLARNIRETRAGDKRESDWQSIPIDHFLRKDGAVKSVSWARSI